MLPAGLRTRYGLGEGSYVLAEARADGILLRPAALTPIEMYSPARAAELLLANAVDARDYARVRKQVQALGLDPDAIPHPKPRRR